MTIKAKSFYTALALAATLGANGVAQAHGADVYWSIGMFSPGVSLGASNAPLVMQPPVVYAPVPMPPVFVAPRPVLYGPPAPVYYGYPDYGRHRGWERRERDDDDHDRGRHWRSRDRD